MVVPFEGQAEVEGACPVNGDFVELHQVAIEMQHVGLVDVFDAEIVYYEGEGYGFCAVLEEARCKFTLVVIGSFKVSDKLIVGKDAGLGKTVHAASNFNVDVIIVDKGMEMIFLENFWRDILDVDLHVLKTVHWGSEVEIV